MYSIPIYYIKNKTKMNNNNNKYQPKIDKL
jgi:hypothetical protein